MWLRHVPSACRQPANRGVALTSVAANGRPARRLRVPATRTLLLSGALLTADDKPRVLFEFSYRAAVPTKKDEWVKVKVPLDAFEATSFGRAVKDAGAVKPEEVAAVGFLLGDKKAGPFTLEVEWIKVVRAAK